MSSEIGSILVATDGSPNAQHAVVWAGSLAGLVGARLVVMSVDSVHQAEASPEFFDEQADELTERLRTWIAEADLPGVQVDPVLRRGRPADVIEAEAEAMSPDLVVVGARGSGGFTRLGLGSTTHRLAHATRVPLVAVHERSALGTGTELFVGVDGSPGSEIALEWAAEVSPSLATEPIAVFVADPTELSFPPAASGGTLSRQLEQDAEGVVARVASRSHIDIKLRVEHGNAVEVLADLADQASSSMVVVGTRSHGPSRYLLGRVPMQLLHHCDQPVVLVPHTPS